MAHVLARTIRVEEDLVDQLFNSSEKRLARLLLLLANFGKDEKPEPVIAKISQETLAEMIGTTRARVSFFMNKFRKLGFIKYNGGIEVHTSLLNAILHDLPQTSKTHARKATRSVTSSASRDAASGTHVAHSCEFRETFSQSPCDQYCTDALGHRP